MSTVKGSFDRHRHPTMADVAEAAGVSRATVSFVVNERADVSISDATRARVQTAVRRLGYRTNLHAQGLRNQRTRTIGFVTDEIAVKPPAGQTVAGMHDVARRHGSVPLIVHGTEDPAILQEVVTDLLDRRVDALVYAVVGTRAVDPINGFDRVPTVLVNAFVDRRATPLPTILPDERAGGRAAAELLLAAGHREIVFLAGQPTAWATVQRLIGMRAALRAAGVSPRDVPVLPGNFRADSGYDLAREVLRRRQRPTALLCGNDLMAVGAYFALKEAGLRVPEDVSVVGYDDQEDLAGDLSPALTTVRIPYYEMGAMAATALVTGRRPPPERSMVPCPPVVRDSVAPVPAGSTR